MKEIIRLDNIKRDFHVGDETVHALRGVSFTIREGEFVTIMGTSGSGKSTLLNTLGCLDTPTSGEYYLDGVSVRTMNKRQRATLRNRKIGFVFQNYNLLPKTTAVENVELPLMYNPTYKAAQRREKAVNALIAVGLGDRLMHKSNQMSGGQMQRVAIASILAMEPEVLLLDEPTSQLDPQGSEEVFHTVELLARTGITIFMIEQKMEKLAAYCDKILLLHKGKQLAFDTPEQIFSREDLDTLGICPPYPARYSKEQGICLEDGTYPVTVEGIKKALRETGKTAGLPALEDPVFTGTAENRFSVHNLQFSYTQDHPIFENFELELDQRPTAIIGQNGAGKTTLVRLLKGLLKPLSGTILYKGEDISGRTVASLASQVGYVFQNPDDQIFKYKVIDEVMFGPLNIGMSKEQAREKALEALELTELSAYAEENPYDLELSQRKLVAIASVLAMDTDVIILDEPTIAQDYKGKEIIRKIITSLSQKGKLVLAILHDMDFVAQCFSRVIVLAHGKLLANGTPSEVFVKEDVLDKAALDMPHPLQLRKILEQR